MCTSSALCVTLSSVSTVDNGWILYFVMMSQYDGTFDLKIDVGHSDQYFTVQ